MVPHPRQAEFLALDCQEALYGGAAGAAKTHGLMQWLAEPAAIAQPKYSGIFFRRTVPQLTRSNDSAISRSHEMYRPLGGTYREGNHCWTFPSGATIEFSHMQHESNKWDHQGPSYHRIAFDELTQFSETQYTYLFSRLRKHEGFPVVIGVRAGTNPDGIGREWVKRRFVTQEAIDSIKGMTAYDPSPVGQVFVAPGGRVFMPARVSDNPTLDIKDYVERLRSQLGSVLSARLANGDWSVSEGSQIDPEDLRYFTMTGEHLVPLRPGGERLGATIDCRKCQRFATIDTAGTSKQKAREDRGGNPSWSVCAIWDYWPKLDFLFCRHVWRERVDWAGLKAGIAKTLAEWSVPLAVIEKAHIGPQLAQELNGVCRTKLVNPVIVGMKAAKEGGAEGAKLERAIGSGFLNKIQDGKVFLPDVGTMEGVSKWMPETESELLSWTGRPEETADQVDVFAYAADHVRSSKLSWGGVINVV